MSLLPRSNTCASSAFRPSYGDGGVYLALGTSFPAAEPEFPIEVSRAVSLGPARIVSQKAFFLCLLVRASASPGSIQVY